MPAQSTLVHGVWPRVAALKDLTKLPLPGRDPRLPDIYLHSQSAGHPGRRMQSLVYNTYVVFVDPSDEGKKHALNIAQSFGTPMGRKTTMLDKHPGLVELFPGDYVFARDKNGDGDPRDDIPQCFVPVRGQAGQDKLDQLDRARHDVLGSREQRSSDKIFFEKDPRRKTLALRKSNRQVAVTASARW